MRFSIFIILKRLQKNDIKILKFYCYLYFICKPSSHEMVGCFIIFSMFQYEEKVK